MRAIVATSVLSALAACGHKDSQQAAGDVYGSPPATSVAAPSTVQPSPMAVDTVTTHHSKLGGALVGAAAGHVLGGHAMAGAAIGALVQHERNKRGR